MTTKKAMAGAANVSAKKSPVKKRISGISWQATA